jgi:hypothetical protein
MVAQTEAHVAAARVLLCICACCSAIEAFAATYL